MATHPHPRIQKAHADHARKLSVLERIAVWASDHLATWQCMTLFVIIGAFSLWGAVFNNVVLTLTFGALSSYFIQLVSLSVIGIGQKIEGERNTHVMGGILEDIEWIKESLNKLLNQKTTTILFKKKNHA